MGKNFNLDEYVPVHERVEKFYSRHPQGRITTSVLEHDAEKGFILIRAEVFRGEGDTLPAATGHAYELRSSGYVQQGSYVEVCETSAVGRALAMLGFEVKRGIASREELQKTARMQASEQRPAAAGAAGERAASASQSAPAEEETADNLDRDILRVAQSLGYDAAKVRKWVNQKFKVSDGLDTLTPELKREVLKIFRERAASA
jgi:hypothetical protein